MEQDGPSCFFFLHALCHFDFFLFVVRIPFSVRETRPLWKTFYKYHDCISDRRQVLEVPKTLYRESAEVGHIHQKCISERSQVIDVPKNLMPGKCRGRPGLAAYSEAVSRHGGREGRESPSRFFERIRERILEQAEKEKNPSVFLTV